MPSTSCRCEPMVRGAVEVEPVALVDEAEPRLHLGVADVVPVAGERPARSRRAATRLAGPRDLVVVQAVLDADGDAVALGVRRQLAQRRARLLEPRRRLLDAVRDSGRAQRLHLARRRACRSRRAGAAPSRRRTSSSRRRRGGRRRSVPPACFVRSMLFFVKSIAARRSSSSIDARLSELFERLAPSRTSGAGAWIDEMGTSG